MSPLHQQESRLTTSSGPQSQPGSLDQVLLPWRGRPLPFISSAVKKHGRIFARLLELNLCALRVAGFLEAVYFFGSLGVLLVPLGDRLLIKERLEMKEPVSFHAPVPLHTPCRMLNLEPLYARDLGENSQEQQSCAFMPSHGGS